MNANVVPFQPAVEAYGARSLTAADVRAQVNLMQDVMAEVMKDGTHYGTIPGTKSKSLYKAGAEKLMATFRLAAKPEVEDLSAHGEIAYRVTVNLLSANGNFIGAGIGECSSAEDKYSWRAAVCDEEFDETPENRRRVKFSKYQGKVEKKKQVRTNPADVANTILKMAKKRAQVDAVITATAASDIFTQDIEDLPDEVVAEIVGKTPARAQVVTSNQPPPVVESPERDALYASLQDIAEGGLEAYAQAWGKLNKEQRAMIGQAAHEGLKAKAERASAEVVK
ncbi:hypothetical protein [Pseudoxanthomonas sp. USHLN014]|uniref:hypothetical protein n=1 Tax=Pseudoxanthomonas sp. USHLN014 TaxID=3081297 RepID=UPI00301BBFCA